MIWFFIVPVLFYFLLVGYIYIHIRPAEPVTKDASGPVKISVIVPCRNEENYIPAILANLRDQDYDPAHFEVIVVDDNSSDGTFDRASTFRGIRNYKILHNTARGKKSAIALGISNSEGELIITTDADCRLGQKWISSFAAKYEGKKPDLIIGPVRLDEKRGFFGRFGELEFLSLQGITIGSALAGKPVMCNGANLCITREAWLKHSVNIRPEIPSGDDIFLLQSLKKDPEALIEWLDSPEGMVTTRQEESVIRFIRQRARWISKSGRYKDALALTLASVTFAAILSVILLIAGSIADNGFLPVLVVALLIKSVPDYLLLKKMTEMYRRKDLLKWFLPSQLVYPFYVLITALVSPFTTRTW